MVKDMSTADAWDRFARENYGVSGDELSASALLDEYEPFFERLHRGETLNLPVAVSKNLYKDKILKRERGPYSKSMVDWSRYNRLHGLRNKTR